MSWSVSAKCPLWKARMLDSSCQKDNAGRLMSVVHLPISSGLAFMNEASLA
jgi:hypothetical protein